MKMKKIITVMIAGITAVFGQEAYNLSLQDALERAIQNNPLVRIERINTDIAASIVRSERAVYETRIRASYTASESENRPFAESHSLSLSAAKDLSTGTAVEVGAGASPAPLTRPEKFQNTVGVTVTQALLQGLGRSVNLVPLRKAEIDINIRREELAGYAQRLLADTERAYWDLLLSGQQINIFRYSLELAQRLLHESEERLRIGGLAPIDLVTIRAEVASRERQLFDAETSYRQKALYLAHLMGAPELWDKAIALTDTAETLGAADQVSDHIDAARMFRPDYQIAFMQARKGELDLIQTRNGLLPRLDFFITLQGTTYSEAFPGALVPGGEPASAIAGGLTLLFPIRNTPARERYRRTTYTVEQQKLSLENFARVIEYEVRSTHMEVYRAQRQIETAMTVSALQLQKLEAEEAKMNAGRSTGYAVLQVQRDLVSASLDEAQARTAYINALISLYSRDGTLLQRRGVRF